MKFLKASWPFVALILVFVFMSAFKFSDSLTDQEKQKISVEMQKIEQQKQSKVEESK
ncbi:hypothetical protein [Bacillus sp. 179-C3.3 HS]|uniref:hypothetical protein n=1 Tax=Bacillus sp. 179-C3.3 HS TaxID=3232162 RepID=UPI0039A0FF45